MSPSPPDPHADAPLRVLFVDDDERILRGLLRMLSEHDELEVDCALGGDDAIAHLERAPYDVVVTDVRMPHMNGSQLLAHVRERFPDAVRVVLSGQVDEDLYQEVRALAHHYLAKPCDADTMLATLRECARDSVAGGRS